MSPITTQSAALDAAQASIACLIDAIAGHHATHLCASAALWQEALRQLPTLDLIRAARNDSNELLTSLVEIVRCLDQHIADEARRFGLKPDQVCPCHEDEIPRARAAIAKAEGREYPTTVEVTR